MICLGKVRIWDRAKLIGDLTLFMESRTFKALILGTLPDAFMVSLMLVKCFQTMILANQSSQTAAMLLEGKKIGTDHSDCQPSAQTSPSRTSGV